MKNLKTIADFKRALTIGCELTMIHHQKFNGRDDKGIVIYVDDEPVKRIVKKVLSTQVCFETPAGKESWINFPKSSQVKIEGNKVTYLGYDYRYGTEDKNLPLVPLLTYIF
jgi:hypothetical protein